MKTIYKVYGISDCPACLRACADLMDVYPDKEYVFVNCDFSKSFRDHIREIYNFPTFPLIVKIIGHREVLVGGSTQLREHLYPTQDTHKAPPIRSPA